MRRSVQSVLGQSFTDLELIVVDDASTDHTQQVLREFSDSRLKVIRREENCSAAVARNTGIDEARGEFVAFNDDDDFWFCHKLERQVAVLRSCPDAVWCLAGFLLLAPSGARYVGGPKYRAQIDYSEGVSRGHVDGRNDWSMVATPGWVVRREALSSVGGFDPHIRSFDDWELGLRLSQLAPPVFVDEPLFVQDLVAGGGVRRQELARAFDIRVIMRKHAEIWANRPEVLSHHWYLIGRFLSVHEPPPAGREELRKALSIRPLYWRYWLALALTYVGADLNRRWMKKLRQLKHRSGPASVRSS
nr:glycosyltransferase family 2 protein [Oceanococcus sp. HetDA_MAG_MS8]